MIKRFISLGGKREHGKKGIKEYYPRVGKAVVMCREESSDA